jgi:integrase
MKGQKNIKWDFGLDNADSFASPKYSGLMESAKDFIYSLMADPIEGHKAPKYSTVIGKFGDTRQLVKWMITNGYELFSQLDQKALEQYELYNRNRQAKIGGDRKGKIKPTALATILAIVNDIYLQRGKIKDAILFEPFDGEKPSTRAGVTRQYKKQNKTERIPEDVSVDLLSKAFHYTEVKAGSILAARDMVNGVWQQWHSEISYSAMLNRATECIKEHGFNALKALRKEERRLRTACYIIIAYFSGMRISEILSIKKGCIEKKKGNNGTDYYLLHSIYYKTKDQPTPGTWLVSEAVVTAIDVFEKLSAPLMVESGKDELFLIMVTTNHNQIEVMSGSTINNNLNKFINESNVVLHNGRKWHLASHQFRKTFAYYMAKENKCNLKFLQLQFKHVSMDMTLWYAITEDEELFEDVDEACEDVSLEELEEIMTPGTTLAGKGGEIIAERRDKVFAGKTTAERRRCLEEWGIDDLYVRSTFYGYCIFNEQHALCNAGFDCQCNPHICKNAVITDAYRENWERLLKRNHDILNRPDLSPLQKAYTQKKLEEFILPTFRKMKWKLEGLLASEKEVA